MLIQTFSFFFQKRTCSFTGPDKLLKGQNLARNRASFLPDQQWVKNFDRFGQFDHENFCTVYALKA